MTSVQLSQPPQATGMASRIATNGTAMKATNAACSIQRLRSAPIVPLGSSAVPADRSAVARGGVMTVPSALGDHTYATVTYDRVGDSERERPPRPVAATL